MVSQHRVPVDLLVPLLLIVFIMVVVGVSLGGNLLRKNELGRCLARVAAGEAASPACRQAWSRYGETPPFPSVRAGGDGPLLVQEMPRPMLAGEKSFLVGERHVAVLERAGRIYVRAGPRWGISGVGGNLIMTAFLLLSVGLGVLFGYFSLRVLLGLPRDLWNMATEKDLLAPSCSRWSNLLIAITGTLVMAGLPLFLCCSLLPGIVFAGGRLLFTQQVELGPGEIIVRPRIAGVALPEHRLNAGATSAVAVGLRDRAAVLAVWRGGFWPLFELPSEEAGLAAWLDSHIHAVTR